MGHCRLLWPMEEHHLCMTGGARMIYRCLLRFYQVIVTVEKLQYSRLSSCSIYYDSWHHSIEYVIKFI